MPFSAGTWNEGITKGQAHDAIDECIRRFPEREAAYQNRPATEEQLAVLRGYLRPDGEEPEDYAENDNPLTYCQAKDLIAECENAQSDARAKVIETFKIECPKCGQHIAFPRELFGQAVDCPACHEQILAGRLAAFNSPARVPALPVVAQKEEVARPALWNILALVGYYRERHRMQQALIRQNRANYIASVLDLIRRGEWTLSVENVVLLRDEKVLWTEPAVLYEWKTVRRHEKAESAVAQGMFIITDQRLIFSSLDQSFSVKPEKLLNLHLYPDGVRFAQDGRKQARALKFGRKNGDVIQAILNQAFAGSP